MLSDFDLAESLWEIVELQLTDADRSAMCVALHTSEPVLTIATALRTAVAHGVPLPANLFDEFEVWLECSPRLDEHDRWFGTWLEIHALAPDVRRGRHTVALGGYGSETLCHFILDYAGMAEAPRGLQEDILRHWLLENRPSPLLRADLIGNGFGHLVSESAPRTISP